ncbi:MAG: hypothetical protein V3U27_05330, partial [Candidatus Tectomicrobia bacterium]
LSLEPLALHQARRALIQLGLVAYEHPLYQVLALETRSPSPIPEASRMTADETPMALKDILKHIAETLS